MTELDDKVRTACHRIEELWNETDGKCYVSFSGGKDSTVLLALIKLCQELYTVGDIPAVFSNTGIELGVTVDFVKWVKENYYPNVKIIYPEKSFDWVLKNKGKPILSKLKSQELHRWHYCERSEALHSLMLKGETLNGGFTITSKIGDKDMHMMSDSFPIKTSHLCCNYMKKKPFAKYAKDNRLLGSIVGIRNSEGGVRTLNTNKRSKNEGKICTVVTKGIIKKMPIVDWSEEDVDAFIQEYNVPLSDAYTKYGFDRTGCMACPYSKYIAHDLEYLFYHEPNRYKAAMHWLKDVYIAQNVMLPFDEAYERERERMWREKYEPMRQEMLRKYRPNSRLLKEGEQLTLFD